MASHVTIIGAGIVGVNCAIALAKTGHKVTVIDREDPGDGCSFGNAGLICASAFEPLASPDTLLKVPGWLLDPEGPLYIQWRHFPRLLPWLFRYAKDGIFGDRKTQCDGLHTLVSPSIELYQQLVEEAGAPDLVRQSGALYAYADLRGYTKDLPGFEARRERGFSFSELNRAEIAEREPHLAEKYKWGYLVDDYAWVTNPNRVVKVLAAYAEKLGVDFIKADVLDLEIGPEGPTSLVTDQGMHPVDKLLIAAGAFSHKLSARFGDPVPLETERGYHVTIENPGVMPSMPIMDDEMKAWITPMEMGLRCAGTVELASLDAPLNERRAMNLLRLAKRMIPAVDASTYTTWMGRRPTLPDSLPVIGRATSCSNVFYAFGHQHLGLTAAPATARLITEIVAGRSPNQDISAFRVDRF